MTRKSADMMRKNMARTVALSLAGLSLAAVASAIVWPVSAQESLLPEGFGAPADPSPKASPTPAPKAAPKAAPKSAPTPPSSGSAGTPSPTTPTPSPSPSTLPSASLPPVTGPAPTNSGAEDEELAESEYAIPGRLKYDLPPGTRRALTRVGPLTPESGGMAPDALGVRGEYATLLMRASGGDFASRWAHILLRRALLSALDTPKSVNGADLAAERADLLLRMGESVAARWMVQAVDYDRASQAMVAAAQQVYLANADPAGLCAYVPAGLAHGNEHVWRLSAGICAGFSGEAGPAGWAISRVRSSGKLTPFDILLAERVLGATGAGRRSTTIEWNGVDKLTDWRFGMATATGVAIPDNLLAAAPAAMRSWTVLTPMTEMDVRLAYAPDAAVRGVLSGQAYLSLLTAAVGDQEPSEGLAAQTAQLRDALGAGSGQIRYDAMKRMWDGDGGKADRYAALILTAQAAAAMPNSIEAGGDPWQLLGSMMAGGYDRNAAAWLPKLDIGTRAWGILAVGNIQALSGTTASVVDDFASDDDSKDQQRSKLLLAGLAGLGRISADEQGKAASNLGVDFAKESRWTRAIDDAAQRREPAMVALLAAIGMQGEWSKVPAYHLYHIIRALRAVGLEAEARMIAAEAVVRV
jgi:hypothetical protein